MGYLLLCRVTILDQSIRCFTNLLMQREVGIRFFILPKSMSCHILQCWLFIFCLRIIRQFAVSRNECLLPWDLNMCQEVWQLLEKTSLKIFGFHIMHYMIHSSTAKSDQIFKPHNTAFSTFWRLLQEILNRSSKTHLIVQHPNCAMNLVYFNYL